MSDFCHLHLHSEYSLLDGANRVDELVERVEEMGQTAVSITDHGRIASVVPFVKKCAQHDIKPIIGCEAYIATEGTGVGDNFHLTLLVLNDVGFQNMVKLTTHGFANFHHRPRIPRDYILQPENVEGLMLLTGCIGAEIPYHLVRGDRKGARQLMKQYRKAFGDRVRVEIMYHGEHQGVDHTRAEDDGGKVLMEEGELNDELIRMAHQLDIDIVATNDAHYMHERDGEHHDTLICKGKGKLHPDRKFRFPGAEHGSHEFWVKTGEEMRSVGTRWDDVWDEACRATMDVAAMVDGSVIDLSRNILPGFDIPEDRDYKEWRKRNAGA